MEVNKCMKFILFYSLQWFQYSHGVSECRNSKSWNKWLNWIDDFQKDSLIRIKLWSFVPSIPRALTLIPPTPIKCRSGCHGGSGNLYVESFNLIITGDLFVHIVICPSNIFKFLNKNLHQTPHFLLQKYAKKYGEVEFQKLSVGKPPDTRLREKRLGEPGFGPPNGLSSQLIAHSQSELS